VQSAYCNSQIGYVDLNVRNTGVITDFFINSFKGLLFVGGFGAGKKQMVNFLRE
jgi:hypothetical protein